MKKHYALQKYKHVNITFFFIYLLYIIDYKFFSVETQNSDSTLSINEKEKYLSIKFKKLQNLNFKINLIALFLTK